MKLLHIIATPRSEESRTLKISNEFLSVFIEKNPDVEIKELNLFKENLPEVDLEAVGVKYKVMGGSAFTDEMSSSWDEIINLASDFLSHDVYLISTPIWNFSVPYKLKHYIDLIMQPGLLFRFTENGVEGLAKDKKMYCVTTRGNDYREGSPMKDFDFLGPYLRSIFGLSGIYDIQCIDAQPMDFSPEYAQAAIDQAIEEVRSVLSTVETKA